MDRHIGLPCTLGQYNLVWTAIDISWNVQSMPMQGRFFPKIVVYRKWDGLPGAHS